MVDTDQYITIGKVINTHGRRGEVRVLPLTDFPERFDAMQKVRVQGPEKNVCLGIEKSYQHKKFIILKLAGIEDMNAAEALKGSPLLITRAELMPLPEDSFYIFDIVGLEVYAEDGRWLGQVQEVLQTGANDVLIVQGKSPRPLLIPALKQVVRSVDKEQGKIIVCLPEGLEELS